MAINVQKLLPPSKSGALVNLKESITKIAKPSSDTFSEKTLDNIGVIKVKVIEIDKILKGTLASEKKKLDDVKKKESSKRREKIEEKLETKPKAETGKVKIPSPPRIGFLDWVKNFIGNVILGYFAIRLVDHLPKIIPIVKFLGKATDFVLDVGGKLLDGLVTFIDWGYKAYDATRGFVKNLFGEDGVKQFDQLSSTLNQFLNLALIAGMAVAGSGAKGLGGTVGGAATRPKPGQGGRPKVTTSGGGAAGRPDLKNPLRQKPKITGGKPQLRLLPARPKVTGAVGGRKAILSSVRPFLKRIPLPVIGALIDFGLSVALGENPGRAAFRAIGAGLLGAVGAAAGTVVPVAGNFIGGLLGGVAGDAIGGVLYDFFFGSGMPSGKGKTVKKAGGGITRGGKPQRGVKRTVTKKGRYKRKLMPKKPGDVEASSPGSDVGGEKKLFGLFSKPELPGFMNPFGVIKKAGKNLGDSDYFGPILAIATKILLGQKPSQQDYKNVGLGINMLVAKGIDDGKLKGGLAAFAEGGFVDPKTLDAISQGGDISDWVAKSFKDATDNNAQKTLKEIQENLRLQKEGGGSSGSPTEEQAPEGTGALVGNTNAEKVFNYLVGYGFTEQAAAGVIGNLMQESGVNPQSKQLGGGPGRGIMQWGTGPGSGGRWDALSAWAASSGKDPWMLDTQVEWMMKEMRSYGTLNRLKGVTDVKKAVQIFEQEMEKAGTPNYPRRYQYAADALSSFGGGKAGLGKYTGEGGMVGGSGKFIQGNSGASRGVHFHIGPGNQTKGTILQPQYNADARASALKALMHFSGNRNVYLGRSDVSVPKGKKIGSAEAAKLISNEQQAHTASGSQGGVDLQVDFESKVPFPLKVFGMKYRRNGFGVSADIEGSNSFVAHGRYDERGKVAPQESMSLYEKGGMTLGRPHMAIIGEKGREFVIDADSTAAIEQTFPGFLGAINTAKYDQAINVLRNFASYESGSQETAIIAMPPQMNESQYEMGDTSSGISMAFGGGDESDPFATLYQGT